MTEETTARRVLAGLGVAGVVGAVMVVVAPDLVASFGVEAVAEARSLAADRPRAFWLAAVGVCCLVWVARSSDVADHSDELPDYGGVSGDGGSVPTVGREFDAAVEAAADAAAEGADHDDARDTLRSVAAEVLTRVDDCSREAAAERVRRGAWTDDAVAASYLADDERAPLRWRLRAWFRPRRARIDRIARTVAAIETRAEVAER